MQQQTNNDTDIEPLSLADDISIGGLDPSLFLGCFENQNEHEGKCEHEVLEGSATDSESECTPVPEAPCQGIFTESEVKHGSRAHRFFIAGRGGETNHHIGNKSIREEVLSHTSAYLSAPPRARGKRFARRLLEREEFGLGDVDFVVRKGYFERNKSNQKISDARIRSVIEHHGREVFDSTPSTMYLSVGRTWKIGIVSDLLRGAASAYRSNEREVKRKAQCGSPSPQKKSRVGEEEEVGPVQEQTEAGPVQEQTAWLADQDEPFKLYSRREQESLCGLEDWEPLFFREEPGKGRPGHSLQPCVTFERDEQQEQPTTAVGVVSEPCNSTPV